MTRAPANPIIAPGSARITSASEAKLAVTPPMVGSVGSGNVLILFVKRSGLDQHRDPLRGAEPEVVTAAVANAQGGRQPGRFERRVALWAGEPVDLLADAGTRRRQSDIASLGTKHGL